MGLSVGSSMVKFPKLGQLLLPIDVALGLPAPSARIRASWVLGTEAPTQYSKVPRVLYLLHR